MIIGCSHGLHVAKSVAAKVKRPYAPLATKRFPDGELYVKLPKPVKGKDVVLVQSFYDEISDCLLEVILAAETAKELGARSVTLVAPHFPYFRQDKRFRAGEAVSIKIVDRMISRAVDRFMVVDPHLHRTNSLADVFSCKTKKLTANHAIAQHIKKNLPGNALIVGPDWESYKWAELVAKQIGFEYAILRKKRFSSHKVEITFPKKVDVKDRRVIIIDDIISSGHTLLETIKHLKKKGIRKITCICVHGILAEGALSKLRKAGAQVITTNTLPNPAAKIDITDVLAEGLKSKGQR